MLRSPLLAAARSARMRSLIDTVPATRSVVGRFVAGSATEDAVRVAREVNSCGLQITLDYLGEDTTDAKQAGTTVRAYEAMLSALAAEGLGDGADVSVKLSAVGRSLPVDGEKISLENARKICVAAAAVGATVTLDMEDHTTTDSTLGILRQLRVDFPWVGAVLQAYLRRTEQDCWNLSGEGSRVRLCKGAYKEPASVAYQDKAEVDEAYERLMLRLMRAGRFPALATHDVRLIKRAIEVARDEGIARDSFEFQMLYGVRRDLQEQLAGAGWRVRVYVPFGGQWYPYFMRRLAERPANVSFLLRNMWRDRGAS
jgi:proline dehydrogenase